MRILRCCLLGACALLGAPSPAAAFDLSGGVSLGGVVAGAKPRFAVTPHAGISWRLDNGVLFTAREALSLLPATNKHGVGIYNQISLGGGYATENTRVAIGPSLSIYSMPACNAGRLCGRVVGVAPGGHVQAELYFAGPLGVSVNASVDYVGGSSPVLPDGAAVLVSVGPVLRWKKR